MKNNMNIDLRLGDCLEVLKTIPDNSVDSVVTDPPYHLTSIVKRFGKEGSASAQFGTDGAYSRASKGFMGKEWDGGDIAFRTDVWEECLRILKPGGHLLAFSHSRTYHRMGVAIEDAGFEIRDQIMWVYGQGFPKSHNIGKAIDKIEGNEREIVSVKPNHKKGMDFRYENDNSGWLANDEIIETKGNSDWEGWGTALKPAHEPIVLARKPLSEKSIAENVLKHGTGGINIDGSRIGTEERQNQQKNFANGNGGVYKETNSSKDEFVDVNGRFPANIIFDEEAGQLLDEQSGFSKSNSGGKSTGRNFGGHTTKDRDRTGHDDKGGASRFFYCPKASKKDRNEGINNLILWENNLQQEQEELNQLLKDISGDMIQQLNEVEWNTIWYGNYIMEQYHQDFKFITETILKLIIGLKTLSYYPHLSTKDYIADATRMIMENGLNLVDYVELINRLKQNIINEEWEYRLGVVSVVLPTLLKIKEKGKTGNFHATVKPTDLMRYLINLVTPPNGTTLDPFMGSGSTGKAAVRCGVNFIGIEREQEYMDIAQARINHELNKDDAKK